MINAQPATPTAPVVGATTQPTCAVATGSVVLSGLPAGNWTINPGGINGNTATTTINNLAPGTYNYTVTNAAGCTSPASADVVINPQPATPAAPSVGAITQPTCAVATGSVVLSGLPAGNWTINPGGINGNTATTTINNLAAGTYTFTVTNSLGCVSPASTSVVINAQPATPTAPVVGAITQPTCTVATGSVVLSGLPAGNWTINPGGIAGNTTSTTISNLAPGTYNYTVTSAAGCTSPASANVVVNAQPATPTAPVVGAITQPTCAVTTGSVVLSGLPAGNWTINPGNIVGNTTSTTINGLAASGTYNFTVTSAAGCTSPASANVVINAQPATPTAPVVGAITQPTCTVATGSVVLSGLPAGNWTINPGGITGNTASTTINNLLPGTYNYTVTNSAGCTSPASANVVINAQPATPSSPSVTVSNPTSCAQTTGSITVNTPAPAPGISYSIDGVDYSNTTGIFSNVTPGTYNVTVQNAAGCISASTPVTVNGAPTAPPPPTATPTDPASCAQTTGSITVNTPAPAPGISYSIDGIDYSNTTGIFNNVLPGTYNVTVKNAAGCISAATPITVNGAPAGPTAPVVGTITQPTCTVATGSVVLSGLPAGNWTINPGNITGSTTSTTVSNLAAGTYTFTVANSLGCVSAASTSVVINAQPATPTAPVVGVITQPTCTVATGSVVLSGLPAGNWTINPGGIAGNTTSTTINNLAPGTYNYTVTNAAGCASPASANVVINAQPATPTAPVVGAITQPTCTVATGSVVLSGLPAGNWTINPGGVTGNTSSTTISGLAASGTYNFTVTSAAGCTSPASANVVINAQPAIPTAPLVGTITQPTCTVATGSVVLSGLPAGNWTINPGALTGSTASTTINNLAPGTYNYTVTNAAGCTSPASADVVINAQPATPAAPGVTATSPASCAQTTGSITVNTPAPGLGISYSIDGSDYSNTTGIFNNVPPGNYNVTVKNAAGCISASTATTVNGAPTAPPPPTATPTDPASCAQITGSITVNTPAPAPGISYSIDGIDYSNTTGIFNNVLPGTYNVTVKNAAGCISTATPITVNGAPAGPTAPVVGTMTQPTCAVATGSVVLSGLPAGNWTINPGNIAGNTSSTTINNLAAGTYTFTVTNSLGCISPASTSVVINPQPATPIAPVLGTITQPDCSVATGSVVLSGLPAGNWTINPGGIAGNTSSTTINNLAPGTYTYTVTNAVGCTSTVSADVVINAQPATPTAPVVGAITQPTCAVATGSVVLSGLPAGNWTINPGGITGNTSSTTISGLAASGTYNFTVTSAAGCTSPASANVVINAQPATPAAPVVGAITQPTCTVATGSVVLSGLPAGNWTINPGGINGNTATTTINNLAPGTYNYTVTNAAGCTSPASADVVINTQPATPAAPAITITSPASCAQTTGSITVNTPAPGPGISYSIDGTDYSNTTGIFNNVAPGNYNVTVKNAAGCVSAATPATVNGAPTAPPPPAAIASDPASCAQITGSIMVTAPAPAPGISYSIDGIDYSNTTGLFTNVAPGTYNVTVKNAAGCISGATPITVNGPPSGPAAPVVGAITQPTCTVGTGSVVLSGLPAGNWTINPGNISGSTSSATISNLAAGTYTFTVTNSLGCISPASANVVIDAQPATPPVPTADVVDPTCTVATGTITVTAPLGAQYTYSIDGTNFQASPTFSSVSPNTYTLTVKDAGGCSSSSSITVNTAPSAPPVPTADVVDPTCTVATGTITVTAPLGAQYTYSIDGTNFQASPAFSSVSPNTYTLTVKDAGGCSSSSSITVNTAPSAPPVPTADVVDPTCTVATGTITVTAPLGAQYTYSIDGTNFQASPTFSSVSPNTYTLTVKDAGGCSSSSSITVNTAPSAPPVPTADVVDPTCTVATGTITVTAPLGAQYTYSIDGTNFQASPTFSSVSPNTYTLTVKDAGGCSSSSSITVNTAPSAPPVPTADVVDPTCTVATGTITVTAPLGAQYTYSIDGTNFQASPAFSSVSPNTYTLTVKDAGGCSSSSSITVNTAPSAPPVPTADVVDPTCTVATGTITVTAPLGAQYTYSIDGTNFQASPAFSSVSPNTYTLTVKDAGGCSSSSSITVNTAPSAPPVPTADVVDPTCTVATGTITVTAPLGAQYTYSIDGTNFQASPTFSSVSPNTYTLTVKDAGGCSSSSSITVNTAPSAPPVPTADVVDPTCTVATGTITVTAPLGAQYTYSIDGTNFQASPTFSSVSPNTYTLTVKDAGGCSSSSSITVNTAPSAPPVPTADVVDPTCTVATGTITVTAPLGAQYTYSIDGTNFQASPAFSSVSPNTYTLTVKDAGGCSSSSSITVNTAPSAPPVPTADVVDPTCTVATGTITVTAPLGAQYTYSIDGTNFQASPAFSSVSPNTYTLTVKDAGGCSSSSSITVNTAPSAPPVPTADVVDPTCTVATGTITVTAPLGAQYTYSIDGTNFQASPTFSSVSPNTYTLTVKDAGGCSSSSSITVNTAPSAPPVPTADVVDPTCTVATGTITVTAPLGAQYTYSIDGTNFQASPTFSSVSPNTYTLTVKDAGGCSSSSSITVNTAPSAPPVPTADVVDPTCTVATGTITVTAPLGAQYTYSIDGTNFQASPAFSSVSPNTYTLTVKDAGGCSSSSSITVNTAPSAPPVPTADVVDPTCTVATGTITVTAPLGAQYTYSIDGTNFQASPAFSSVSPNTYTLTVKDAGGCSSSSSITVNTAPSAPPVPTADVVDPTCTVATGTITVTAPLGAQYTYSIDGTNFQASPTFSSVSPNTYTLTVKDAGGCSSSSSITVNTAPSAPPVPTADVVDPTCTVATGTITVTAPLGAQYTYSIDGTNFQASPAFSSVSPNTYTLTVKDAGGCSSSSSITVNTAPSAPPVPTADVVDPTCTVATGTITVTAPLGAQYTYSIDGTNFQASPAFSSVSPNTYTLTVKDAGGCSSSSSITVNTAPSAPPVPTADVVDPTCTVATGTITVTAPLGAQYTYSIDGTNFQASPAFSSVSPNTYTLTVKDAGGCSSSSSITVNTAPSAPPVPTADVVDPTCTVATGTITVTAPLGAQYTYSIDGTNFQASPTFSSVSPNTYTLTVKDAGGCSSSSSITVNTAPSAPPVPTADVVDPTCTVATGTITVTAPLGAQYTYSIDGTNFQASPAFSSVSPNTYTLTVKDAGGCSSSSSITVNTAPSAPPVPTADVVDPTCTVATGTITVTAPLGAQYTYSIDGTNFQASPTFSSVSPNTYTLTVKDAGGCSSSSSITVNTAPSAPPVPTADVVDPTCTVATGTITVTAPLGAQYTYSIDGTNFQASPAFSSVSPNTYTLTVKDAGGCSSSSSITVNTAPSAPPVPTADVVDPTCTVATGTITVTAPLGAQYTYSIDGTNFQASPTFSSVSPNTYTLTVKDAGGCSSSSSITVNTAPSAPPVPTADVVDPTCTVATGTITVTAPLGAQYTYSIDGTNFQASPTFSSVSPNTYTLTVKDAGGCSSSSSITVNTAPSAPPVPTADVVDPTCTVATGTITVTAPLGAQYTYSIDGTNFQASPTFSSVSPNTYTLTVKDAGGCSSSSSITVNTAPSAPPAPVVGTTTQPTCTVSTGSVVLNSLPAGTWTINPGNLSGSTTSTTISGLAPGTYNFTVSNASGCTSPATVDVVINAAPIAPTLDITDPAAACSPNTVDLTAASVTAGSDPGLIYSYWTNSAGTSALANPTAVATSGTYYIEATNGSCTVIKPVVVTINIGPAPNVVITDPARVCAPATVDLTNPGITAGSDPNLTYTYWVDAANTIPIPDPKAVSVSGTYYITGTALGGCSSTKSVQVVVTIAKATPGMRYPTVITSSNTPVALSARDLGVNYTYLWQPPLGLNFDDVKDPTFNYNQQTDYTVTITPPDGTCPTTDSVLVQIATNGALQSSLVVPNAWSPNGDGHNDKLYPLTINIKEIKYFRIYDRWGQLMFETTTIGQGWDGTFNGVPQVMDVYTWMVEADGLDGVHYKLAGNSILMR